MFGNMAAEIVGGRIMASCCIFHAFSVSKFNSVNSDLGVTSNMEASAGRIGCFLNKIFIEIAKAVA